MPTTKLRIPKAVRSFIAKRLKREGIKLSIAQADMLAVALRAFALHKCVSNESLDPAETWIECAELWSEGWIAVERRGSKIVVRTTDPADEAIRARRALN